MPAAAGSAGGIRWGKRPPCGPWSPPARCSLPTRSGLLAIIDLASGDAAGAVRFRNRCARPCVDPSRPLAFLVGRQQQIYVVSLADGHCKQVFRSGAARQAASVHRRWSGAACCLVAVNDRLWESTLHVLSLGADESAPLAPLAADAVCEGTSTSRRNAPGGAWPWPPIAAPCTCSKAREARRKTLKKIAELPACRAGICQARPGRRGPLSDLRRQSPLGGRHAIDGLRRGPGRAPRGQDPQPAAGHLSAALGGVGTGVVPCAPPRRFPRPGGYGGGCRGREDVLGDHPSARRWRPDSWPTRKPAR